MDSLEGSGGTGGGGAPPFELELESVDEEGVGWTEAVRDSARRLSRLLLPPEAVDMNCLRKVLAFERIEEC